MDKIKDELKNKFYDAVLSLKDEKECAAFFYDICTFQELQDITQRLDVAERLINGENYMDINNSTGVSTATIGRVSRCVKYGTGGYETVISRLDKEVK